MGLHNPPDIAAYVGTSVVLLLLLSVGRPHVAFIASIRSPLLFPCAAAILAFNPGLARALFAAA
jgi:hypothetical protein